MNVKLFLIAVILVFFLAYYLIIAPRVNTDIAVYEDKYKVV